MPHYKDMEADQRAAVRDLLLKGVDQRIKEESHYTTELYRFLTLANAAGLALLASFVNGIASRGASLAPLVGPFWAFLIGAMLSVLILVPLTGVASQATAHSGNQFMAFVLNQTLTENLIGYGFNRRGRIIVSAMALASMALFVCGVVLSLSVILAL